MDVGKIRCFKEIRPGRVQGGQNGVWAGAFRIDKVRTIRFEAGQDVRLRFSGAPLARPWPGYSSYKSQHQV